MSCRRRLASCGVSACLVLLALAAACDAGGSEEQRLGLPQDSIATARETIASVTGGATPGANAYSFRGLYAGMKRSQLETLLHALSTPSASGCRSAPQPNEIVCAYEGIIGRDSARVGLEVVYSAAPHPGDAVAHQITVTRMLPLDVDGVRLAHTVSDAFAAQTALLDKREASYGHHQAQVRMGTLNGRQKNSVDLTVALHEGREMLTVTIKANPPALRER